MTVEKLESGKKYDKGMRYKLIFCGGDFVQYLTESAFEELGRRVVQIQNTSSNSEYKQLCKDCKHNNKNPWRCCVCIHNFQSQYEKA